MKLEQSIRSKIESELHPTFLEIENESAKHNRPAGSETHFRLVVVTPAFSGLSRVDRQRLVTQLLDAERAAGLHALALRTHTPEEWAQAMNQAGFQSPDCLHQPKNK